MDQQRHHEQGRDDPAEGETKVHSDTKTGDDRHTG